MTTAPDTAAATGAELATRSATPEQIEQARAAILDGAAIPDFGDPELVSRAIVERLLGSDTFEQAFKPQELESWQEYLGVPFLVRDFHLNRTRFEDRPEGAPSVYAVCTLERLDGEEPAVVTVTTGGQNVLAQLLLILEKGWWDNPVKMIAKDTATAGRKALWLEGA